MSLSNISLSSSQPLFCLSGGLPHRSLIGLGHGERNPVCRPLHTVPPSPMILHVRIRPPLCGRRNIFGRGGFLYRRRFREDVPDFRRLHDASDPGQPSSHRASVGGQVAGSGDELASRIRNSGGNGRSGASRGYRCAVGCLQAGHSLGGSSSSSRSQLARSPETHQQTMPSSAASASPAAVPGPQSDSAAFSRAISSSVGQ